MRRKREGDESLKEEGFIEAASHPMALHTRPYPGIKAINHSLFLSHGFFALEDSEKGKALLTPQRHGLAYDP